MNPPQQTPQQIVAPRTTSTSRGTLSGKLWSILRDADNICTTEGIMLHSNFVELSYHMQAPKFKIETIFFILANRNCEFHRSRL